MTIVKCQKCGADIFWAKSPRGSRIPMDAERVVTYTVCDEATQQLHANSDAYICHYSTCQVKRRRMQR